MFPGAPRHEVIDGIRIHREGRQWTVHFRAWRRYRGKLRGQFDVVIDEINTIPFFTPLWASIPVFAMIWQLAREVWWYESRFPLNAIGFAVEPIYLRTYRETSTFTFSASTEADLRSLGFQAEITVLPVGIQPVDITAEPKSPEPCFIYVGRLAPSKRVHEIIQAFAFFRHQQSTGRLALVGNGPKSYVRRLTLLAEQLGISNWVEHVGWLEGTAKHRVMMEAHALLMASAREGWGLVVTECNSCGTPAIVYDVPGLRDSVRNLQTGIVTRPNARAMAEGMLRLTGDAALYKRLREASIAWSRTFTYEAGAMAFIGKVTQNSAVNIESSDAAP